MSIRTSMIESLPVQDFYDEFKDALDMHLVAGADGMHRVVREKSINRPSLALTGYSKYFAYKRIQLFGAGEMAFIRDSPPEQQLQSMRFVAQSDVPCIVVSRQLMPTRAMIQVCEEENIPLIRTPVKSKNFTTEATVLLEEKMAPRTTMHGTLMDIRGIGVLLQGQSGIGKSECALALIERGHSLVADDLTYLKLVGDRELIGTSAELNRGYMECRGIGIINIADLFGVRAVRPAKRLDLIVNFVEFKQGMVEDRTGLEHDFVDILGMQVPHMEIPVRPGRDMARLVEVATMVQALRVMGHDSAQEFNKRLIEHMAQQV
ncbi:MAG: HPr(Ser) kinase/phosphatase [Verrucomicrobiota bacterium]